jgi:hypothetical protein
MANGIVMCNVPGANELIMNQHAQDDPQVIVANQNMIEIFQASRTLDEGVPKISLARLFLIGKQDLPVHIATLDAIAFDLHHPKVFFAIGHVNQAFVEAEKA